MQWCLLAPCSSLPGLFGSLWNRFSRFCTHGLVSRCSFFLFDVVGCLLRLARTFLPGPAQGIDYGREQSVRQSGSCLAFVRLLSGGVICQSLPYRQQCLSVTPLSRASLCSYLSMPVIADQPASGAQTGSMVKSQRAEERMREAWWGQGSATELSFRGPSLLSRIVV